MFRIFSCLNGERAGRLRAEERLREQNVRLDMALNNISQGLCMFDPDETIVVFNRRFMEMYKLSPQVVKPGCKLRDLIQHRKDVGLLDADTRRHHRTPPRRERARPQPGLRHHGYRECAVDNRRQRCRDLRYVLINRAGERHFGIPRDTMIGKRAEEVFPKDEAELIASHDREALETDQPRFYDERPATTPAGRHRIVATARLPIRDAQGAPQYLLTVIDVRTHHKRTEAQIARLVHHDLLTGISNRAAFSACIDATVDAARKDGHSFALMCLDLDRFKEVNDVFGHAAGDELLLQLSKRLQAAAGGAFLARLGGDEFVVIATDGNQPSAAESMADRLLAAVGDDIVVDGHSMRVGVSIGIAIFPVDGSSATALIANADAALYRAKADGRGTFRFFEADMDRRLRERRVLQQELRSAIERSELVMHYQSLARIAGEVIGFEALVRWQHPQRGLVSPATFIPLAEESGLIVAMGEWIMRAACREAASWPRPLQIAVNLSPVQFRHGDLPGLVHTVLLETGLAPSRLELEITEGALIADFSRAVSILRRLKALGVRIAMDDFGTGYSSLSYLQSFPFDKIKIDQTFISNLERNPQSAAIIRAVIGLARGLEMPVLAEGVETKDQLAFLSKESCDEVQGFLIGKPLPIEHYGALTGKPMPKMALAGAVTG